MRKFIFKIYALLFGIFVFILGFVLGLKIADKEVSRANTSSRKNLDLLKMAVKWIKNRQRIELYMKANRNKKIAVYGMGFLGDCMVEVIKDAGLDVVCGIDRNAELLYNRHVPILKPDSDLPMVEIVIVAAVDSYEDIKYKLRDKLGTDVMIISLEDILYYGG